MLKIAITEYLSDHFLSTRIFDESAVRGRAGLDRTGLFWAVAEANIHVIASKNNDAIPRNVLES